MQELSPKQVEQFLARPRPLMRSKYRSRRVKIDGIWFDSRAEAARYVLLIQAQKKGEVRNLKIHSRFKLTAKNSYVADFEYDVEACCNSASSCHVVEDCKGFRTPVYKLKKQLMKEKHGIDILETTVPAKQVDAILLGYINQTGK